MTIAMRSHNALCFDNTSVFDVDQNQQTNTPPVCSYIVYTYKFHQFFSFFPLSLLL